MRHGSSIARLGMALPVVSCMACGHSQPSPKPEPEAHVHKPYPSVGACVDPAAVVKRDPRAVSSGTDPEEPRSKRSTRRSKRPSASASTKEADKPAIARVISYNLPAVRDCYQLGLERDGALEGMVVIGFVITPSGAVESSWVRASTLNHPPTELCVASRACSWVFPPPRGGRIVRVSYPFVFATRE